MVSSGFYICTVTTPTLVDLSGQCKAASVSASMKE